MDAEKSQSEAGTGAGDGGAAGEGAGVRNAAARDAAGEGSAAARDAAENGGSDAGGGAGQPPVAKPAPRSEQPTIPVVPFDETDAAWGEYPQDSDDWLRQQRPPHHGG